MPHVAQPGMWKKLWDVGISHLSCHIYHIYVPIVFLLCSYGIWQYHIYYSYITITKTTCIDMFLSYPGGLIIALTLKGLIAQFPDIKHHPELVCYVINLIYLFWGPYFGEFNIQGMGSFFISLAHQKQDLQYMGLSENRVYSQ